MNKKKRGRSNLSCLRENKTTINQVWMEWDDTNDPTSNQT